MREERASAADPARGKPDGPHADRPGVLVVDDDHLVRIMVRTGLERNGFDVWLASGADEALAQYQAFRDRIAVVLLDVRMPGRDGLRILQDLRELNPGVPVCFMSADTGDYRADELIRRGAACVVSKPFLLNELAETLRRMARGLRGEVAGAVADGENECDPATAPGHRPQRTRTS